MIFYRRSFHYVAFFSLISTFTSHLATAATNLNDPSAPIISVKKACGSTSNCAESFSDLLPWLWTTRNPDASSPLSILVDPGEFVIPKAVYYCDGENNPGRGHIALTGAGRDVTILRNQSVGRGNKTALQIRDCESLTFNNLAIKSEEGSTVKWEGGGSSTWNNVDLESSYTSYTWYDRPSNSGECSIHYWFGSRLTQIFPASYSTVYRSSCGESWFYGSDIAVLSNNGGNNAVAFNVASGSSARIFGSSVRAIIQSGAPGSNNQPTPGLVTGIVGGLYSDGGAIHMHGGIVSVQALGTGNVHVFSTKASSNGGTIHTPDTAFTLIPSGSGTATRILKHPAAKIMAPFTWPSNSTPPNIISISGEDTFIETDCDNTGNCDNPQGAARPHTLVYDSSCTATLPWFDMATNKCRGE